MSEIYTIDYLGKKYNTTIKKPLTDEQYLDVVKEYYQKPSMSDVENQMIKFYRGGWKTNYIIDYYCKDIMAKTRIHYNNWTIEEALRYKPIIEFFHGKSDTNKKVFPDTMSLTKKIETAFRLCGFGVCSKPSNFPIKAAEAVIQKYNINNSMYDFSCGWGIRMLSALRNGVNYYGTDPNYLLCDRLCDMAQTFKAINNVGSVVTIIPHGSEIFVGEWANKFGLAFSSPPYYNLEDYRIGDQSYKPGVSYEDWKLNYLEKTLSNIYSYLIVGGILAININNFKKYNRYDLVQDTFNITESLGMNFLECIPLVNIKRCHGHREWDGECGWNDNREGIFIFQKQH